MKLRNRQRIVSTGEEGLAPRAWTARVTAVLYYLLLAGVVGYIAYFIGNRMLFFGAPGLVTIGTAVLAPTREGRVAELRYAVGDTVAKGALVARVDPGLACQRPDETRLNALRTELRLTEAKRVLVAEQIAATRERLETLRLRAPLELDQELRRDRTRLQDELRELESEHRLLGIELGLQQEAVQDGNPTVDDPRCLPDLVHAPLDGTVYAVHRVAFDVVNAGDPILSLQPLTAPVRIMAYMDPDNLASVFPDKRVRVRFPDGSEDDGVIHAVRAAAESFAELDVENYRFQDSDVLAEIRPADSTRAHLWQRFDRLQVRVTGRRRAR